MIRYHADIAQVGHACQGCGEPIEPHDILVEVRRAKDDDEGAVHERCLSPELDTGGKLG